MRWAIAFLWLTLPAVAAAQAPPVFVWEDGFEFCAAPQPFWPDRDKDGFGDDNYLFVGCIQPPGFYPVVPGDCDDLNAAVNPAAFEVCNGTDDNCDGQVDEGNPGGGGLCNTGLPGFCAIGTMQCMGVSGLICTPDNPPVPEICNGIDDDCDGAVDEGNPGGGATCDTGFPGMCQTGTLQCTMGSLVCQQNSPPQPEICDNGIDDDCDGFTDDDDGDCAP